MLKACSRRVVVKTFGPMKLHDVTEEVLKAIEECRVTEGVARVDVKGATPALVLIDPRDASEFTRVLARLIPFSRWRHGNAYAHLASTTLGTSLTIAIENGSPLLPEGSRVYLLETRSVYNHPRELTIIVIGRDRGSALQPNHHEHQPT